jgi:hypothetical protein
LPVRSRPDSGIIAAVNPVDDLPSELRRYVRDGRISVMPARRAARLLLLDQVAQAFEPGRRYSEPAVNEILKSFYDDHATLRRYLVDEELLSRTPEGTYWRSGGTVPVSPLAPMPLWSPGTVGTRLPITSDYLFRLPITSDHFHVRFVRI